MGVPKFFRYISERYPCLSEVVREHQIPEFDNLYLDMNGIIHVCSHPNDFDPHFRISDENIFNDIFHYIEILFRMIQPQRLFFMAVDGVAPRAKMNQQRGRRFRSAKEAEVLEAKARANNEILPDAERFDSNCITPGTLFMTRLHAQLRYFVNYKISTDKLWQKPTIILSGHETPGEGEHKIMDYIRFLKSQPGYEPDTRHCLYGLDADLIMLGLCTHEPHFSLLREEVKFGKNCHKKRASVPEEIKFYLLHLSLMREYLELEFQELKDTLPFPFNLENIIDDWVLMGFLVGNDFIPHLPNLHIASGALPILYKAYMDVLPSLGGYINEGGSLNLPRFQKYMEKLAGFDLSQFKDTLADLKYFQGKTGRRPNEKERTSYRNGDENSKNEEEPVSAVKDPGLSALIQSTNVLFNDEDDPDIYYSTDEDDEEAMMFAEFYQHKNDYYINKLEYDKVTPEVLRSQAEGYVRAIQWNLNYYYNGCCSWSWYYPHHYAPFISDIKNFEDLKIEFELGEPFMPFQQLLAVLPAASKKLLPEPFQELMVDEDSPIIDFYPTSFKTDMNGKKQEWEAVVLIPFINQDSLLKAMATKYDRLTDEEKRRNGHGPMLVYNYTPENQGTYEAPEYYPTLSKCFAKEVPVGREQIFVERSKLIKGLLPGVKLDVYYPGFPTLRHLEFTGTLKKAKVKVFDQPSRGENLILTLKKNKEMTGDLMTIATKILDKTVFVGWPNLTEATVIAIASKSKRLFLKHNADGSSTVVSEDLTEDFLETWKLAKNHIEENYMTKQGVDCKPTEIIVYVRNLLGRKYAFTSSGRVSYEKKWADIPSPYGGQTIVYNIAVKVPNFVEHLTIDELFKPSTVCFTIGNPHYGAMGTVCEGGKNGRVKFCICVTPEPDLETAVITAQHCRSLYKSGHIMSQRLGISSHLLSRLTGSIFVVDNDSGSSSEGVRKTNIGLNLKFNKRNEEVCGYTKKENNMWLYSLKAERLINDYMRVAPDVISYIGSNPSNDVYNVKDIFPENSEEELKKVVTWLNEQDVIKAERITCGTEILEEEVVSVIEKIVDNNLTKNIKGKTVVMQIKPHLLLLPKTSAGLCPDYNAVHKVFDRIVCIRESFTVPLGLKGTIIGQQKAEKDDEVLYDVVFDKEFVGGIQIRCSKNRGYRLNRMGFINLSHGIRSMENKERNSQPVPVHQSDYNKFNTGQWNIRNSAFASCNNTKSNKQYQPQLGSNNMSIEQDQQQQQQQQPIQFSKQKMQSVDNLFPKFPSYFPKESSKDNQANSDSKKAPSEFQAMWDELQNSVSKSSNSANQVPPQSADASDALKKILKIADSSNKRKPTSSATASSINLPVKEDRRDFQQPDASRKNINIKQLEDFLYHCNAQKPIYTYEYLDGGDQALVICKLFFEYPEEVERTFTSKPSVTLESAAENVASLAVKSLQLEDGISINSFRESEPSVSDNSSITNSTANTSYNHKPDVGITSNYHQNRHTQFPFGVDNLANKGVSPLMNYNYNRSQNNFQHQQRYNTRNAGGPNNHWMANRNPSEFNWFNPDLPTPPFQWRQRQHQSGLDNRYSDRKPRQDYQGGGGSNMKQNTYQHPHHQSMYNNGHHQQQNLHHQSLYPYQHPNSNQLGQSSHVPNWKQPRPMPHYLGQPPFIPLQAITQHRTGPSACSNFISKSSNDSNQLQETAKSVVDGSRSGSNQPSYQSRPPTVLSQPRRPRIAAKFNVQFE